MIKTAEIASGGRRFGNLIIDSILVGGVWAVIAVLSIGGDLLPEELFRGPGGGITFGLLYGIYCFGFEVSLHKTPAKFITRTRVVAEDGARLTAKRVALRSLCRLVPFEPLSALGDGASPLWHDRWSKTNVVMST